MSEQTNLALQELSNVSPTEALAILDRLEQKRQEVGFIRYWKPYPQGKQIEVFQRFTADKKVFVLLGGNRSGKTEVGAFIALAWLLGKDYFRDEPAWDLVKNLPIPEGRPRTIWVVGLDFPTVRDVIWREKFVNGKEHPALLPKDDFWIKKKSDGDFQIFAADGSILTCKSADSGREKFQGASVDLAWIDEECEVDVFDEVYQRTVDCAGHILITLTPLKDSNSGVRTPWVYDLYEDWKSGDKKDLDFVFLSVLDNPFVPDAEKLKLKEKWAGHYEERARLYGEFVQRAGLVYPQWDPRVHLRALPLSRGWRRVACIDPAATGTTACLWVAVSPNSDLYFYKEYYERDHVVSDHAKNILSRNGGDPIDLWLIDPKWGAQRQADDHRSGAQLYRDAGIPVRLAEVGEDYGLNASREYLSATANATSTHPRAYFAPTLKDFQFEISRYVWDFFQKGDQKVLSKDKPRKRNDHLMNTMQYLCAQNLRPKYSGRDTRSDEQKLADVRVNSYTI